MERGCVPGYDPWMAAAARTSKRKRSVVLPVHLLPVELEQLRRVAAAHGMAPSTWVRGHLLELVRKQRRLLRASELSAQLPEREQDKA